MNLLCTTSIGFKQVFPAQLGMTGLVCLWLLSIYSASVSAGLDTLSGPLPKRIPGDKLYLVISDIEIPFGKTVTIEPGAQFLFQNFTSFQVQGQLIAEGTKAAPIIFTSEFDGTYHPDTTLIANPFDWNGIYIHKDAFGTRLKFCKIFYSVYGVASDTRLIRLDPCMFGFNGKSDLMIADSMHIVKPKSPYKYVLTARDATVEGVSIKLIDDPQLKKRNIIRYSSAFFFAGGVAAVITGYYRYRDSNEVFDARSSDDFSNLNAYSQHDWENARRDKNLDLSLLCVGIGAGVLGATGFIWTFSF